MGTAAPATVSRADRTAAFRRGVAAVAPLWLGMVPFAVAFALLAGAAAGVVAAKGGPLWGTLAVGVAAFWLIRLL